MGFELYTSRLSGIYSTATIQPLLLCLTYEYVSEDGDGGPEVGVELVEEEVVDEHDSDQLFVREHGEQSCVRHYK